VIEELKIDHWANDQVVPVIPLSTEMINSVAKEILGLVSPEHLLRPGKLDMAILIERTLPRHNIYFEPTSECEMGGNLACVQISKDELSKPVSVLIREDLYTAIVDGGDSNRWARSTAAHELGHVILHVQQMRAWLSSQSAQTITLARKDRGTIKPYYDPEWQAWAFAGFFLAPTQTMPPNLSHIDLANIYGVTPKFMMRHLDRAKRLTGVR
jgi:Zn-dependent peptidase ImmA (M78 family)